MTEIGSSGVVLMSCPARDAAVAAPSPAGIRSGVPKVLPGMAGMIVTSPETWSVITIEPSGSPFRYAIVASDGPEPVSRREAEGSKRPSRSW